MYVWYSSQALVFLSPAGHQLLLVDEGVQSYELRCCISDGQPLRTCITVRQAPFRCVGLWAKHWAMEMLSPRSSPEGGLSLPRKSSLHICVTVSHSRNHQQTSWLCEEGPLVQWERPIWESFLEAVTLELILEGQV